MSFRASPVIAANSDRVVVWSETNTESGSSSDQDIVYSSSNDDGTSWSDYDDVSEHYYEAFSGLPSLAYSGDFLSCLHG